jgi:ABC-type branched-subunit amino acid transport system substrate-binding protein
MKTRSGLSVWAIAALMAIGAGLSACMTSRAPAPPPPPQRETRQLPPRSDQPHYYRLRRTPANRTPVRVALLLPLSNPSAETRALADALEKAAELALFDSGNADIIIMPRDEGGSPALAAQAASAAINDGAEIILGPLFSQTVAAVAPVARAQGVPVIAFSSDRAVGGDGVYLLSFQPEDEVARVVSYAAAHGHSNFAALVPQNAYGGKVEAAFRESVGGSRGKVVTVGRFGSAPDLVAEPARATAAANPDAILVAQGGPLLRAIAPALAPTPRVKLLGTSQWNDVSVQRESLLNGAWFAAPAEHQWRSFAERYASTYGARPPRIASLAYDAMSLVALLARGEPYQRYTEKAITDPNGFSGVDGIFRFHFNGGVERGLAVMEVAPDGFRVVDPAPRTFQQVGS